MKSMAGRPGLVDYGLLLALAFAWGSSYMFIKLAIDTVPPITLTAGRISIAAVLLLVVARLAGEKLVAQKAMWPTIFLAGFFGNALPFFLISWGEEQIDSTVAAILMAVMPITTVVLAHFFTNDEKLNRFKIFGVMLGLVGLIVLIGPSTLAKLGDNSVRQLAVAAAAMCYGVNALLTKKLAGQPPRILSAWIITASAIMVVPASFVFESPLQIAPTSQAVWAVISLGFIQTALATYILVVIVRRQGASFFAQVNFLIPFVGVLLGGVFLGERIGLNAVFALTLILTGIAITRYGGIWGARRG
jgi:drug/metabolite transporter (DMT)-like permease